MQYSDKFQTLCDIARSKIESVQASQVDSLMANGAIALDIRDKEEHDNGHIHGSMNISRGKLEMIVEKHIPNLDTEILCYCNANNRGSLSAASLREMGYKNAKVIDGGLGAYKNL